MSKLIMNPEQKAQLEEGRRLAAIEAGASNLPKGAPRNDDKMLYKPSVSPHKPQKPKAKGKPGPAGHEALLDKLKSVGGLVRIRFLDSDIQMTGKVMHADKWSISVQVESYRGPDYETGETAVIFKHAIASFVPSEKRNV